MELCRSIQLQYRYHSPSAESLIFFSFSYFRVSHLLKVLTAILIHLIHLTVICRNGLFEVELTGAPLKRPSA